MALTETDGYILMVDYINNHDYCSLIELINDEKASKFLREKGFELLEMLIYTFMENKDKLIIRCMKLLNRFVAPKERLLVYLMTIDNISSLTLCLHFTRNLYKDLSVLNKENIVEVRTTMVPKLYRNLVQYAQESGGTFDSDCTILIIFMRAVVRLYVKSGCDDETIRIGFITEVLMKRPFENKAVRSELCKFLNLLSYHPRCFEGLWIPCLPEELPFFILNECADDERTDLLPRVYHPTFLLRIIAKPISDYFEKSFDDPVFLKNVFVSVTYVGRMIEPLSISRNVMAEYKCLFTSLLKTSGTFREIVDTFTTIEVFTLLLENLEPLGQYLLLRELIKMLYNGELQNEFVPYTIALLVDLYRKSTRHDIKQYQVFRDEIGAFYAQMLSMMDEAFDVGYAFYSSVCIMIQVQSMLKFNYSATKKAKEILTKIKDLVDEEKEVHSTLAYANPNDEDDDNYQDYERVVLLKVRLVEFEIKEAEDKLSVWESEIVCE